MLFFCTKERTILQHIICNWGLKNTGGGGVKTLGGGGETEQIRNSYLSGFLFKI